MFFNGTGPSFKLLLTVENGGFENANFLQDFADWENLMSIPAAAAPQPRVSIEFSASGREEIVRFCRVLLDFNRYCPFLLGLVCFTQLQNYNPTEPATKPDKSIKKISSLRNGLIPLNRNPGAENGKIPNFEKNVPHTKKSSLCAKIAPKQGGGGVVPKNSIDGLRIRCIPSPGFAKPCRDNGGSR